MQHMAKQTRETRSKWIGILTLGSLLAACGLPPNDDKSISQAVLSEDSRETILGRNLAPQAAAHPGLSGVLPLTRSLDAFAARMLLIADAQQTLDVQYYIWRDDITGNLLFQALLDASKRGVRVRLLLDDNGVSGLDEKLSLLNSNPGIEVRLFNPFPFRTFKPLGFVTDFPRLNRRMHNKSFIVDGQAAIAGGRNIGDEYFGATQGVAFADLDVLVAGAVVDEVSKDFDRYWNHEAAYPLETLVAQPSATRLQQMETAYDHIATAPQAHAYVRAVTESRFIDTLRKGSPDFLWVPVRLVSDDPDKVLGRAAPETLLLSRLDQILDKPAESIELISPYFVPTKKGADAFIALARQGVRLQILTNALEATDVTAVHAGYAPYRKTLLQENVTLYEMRRQANQGLPQEKAGPFGSSGSSLHAKTFAVDGARVFIGSFNFDPRSARLNTESGFVIHSPEMARDVANAFKTDIPANAYELGLDETGRLYWIERNAKETRKLDREPATPWWKRLYVRFLSMLPIESLL